MENVYGFKENKCKERVLPEKETLSITEIKMLLGSTFLKATCKSSEFCENNTIPKKSDVQIPFDMSDYSEKDEIFKQRVEDLELLNITYTQYDYSPFVGDLITIVSGNFKDLEIKVTKDKEGNCIYVVIENPTANDIVIPDGELTVIFIHKNYGLLGNIFSPITGEGNRHESI